MNINSSSSLVFTSNIVIKKKTIVLPLNLISTALIQVNSLLTIYLLQCLHYRDKIRCQVFPGQKKRNEREDLVWKFWKSAGLRLWWLALITQRKNSLSSNKVPVGRHVPI